MARKFAQDGTNNPLPRNMRENNAIKALNHNL